MIGQKSVDTAAYICYGKQGYNNHAEDSRCRTWYIQGKA